MMTTHIFMYKITQEYEYKLLHYHGPKDHFLLPEIIVDSKNKSISFDFQDHIIEINVHATLFLRIDIKDNAIGILVNSDPEHLNFSDVNEQSDLGLFLPNVSFDHQYYDEEQYVIVDYGKAVFAIKEAVMTYYTSPINPDIESETQANEQGQDTGMATKFYFYRVFNNPGINQGALLIQKGEKGFPHNSMTMFLNSISFGEISNIALLNHVLRQDPQYVELMKSVNEQLEQLKDNASFKKLTSFIKNRYDEFLKNGEDIDVSFDLNAVNKDNFQDYYNFQQEMNKILSENVDYESFEDEFKE